MVEWIRDASAAFATNGGADGYFTVTDSSPFYAGAYAWISDDDANSQKRVQITEVITASQKIGLRFVADNENAPNGPVGLAALSYGRSDISAYTTAKHARIDMEGQAVRIQQPYHSFPSR